MEKYYTSFELSKKIAEGGCKIETGFVWRFKWVDASVLKKTDSRYVYDAEANECFVAQLVEGNCKRSVGHPAFDILNDICCKYAKEFFGTDYDPIIFGSAPSYAVHTQHVLRYMQQGKKEEAEEYIWENCLFNPKNKEKNEN